MTTGAGRDFRFWILDFGLRGFGRAVLFIAVCSLFCPPAQAGQPYLSELHRLFATANEHYQNKRFKEALEGYRHLIELGVRDPILFYNTGNAYVQLDQRGRAVAMYERALRLAPRDKDARKNLAYVQPADGLSAPFILWRPFLFLRDLFSLNEWLVIADALLLCIAVTWSVRLLARRQWIRSAGRAILVASLVLTVAAAGFMPWRWYVERGRRVGVIIAREVVSRHGPSTELGEHLRLAEGARVQILSNERNGWLCVCHLAAAGASREHTYIREDAVEEI